MSTTRCRRSLALCLALSLEGASLAAQPHSPAVEQARRLAEQALRTRKAEPLVGVQANETCRPHLILCGQVKQKTLSTTDCSLAPNFFDGWYFPNYSRQAVGIAMSSPDFDVLTGLADAAGNVLGSAEAPKNGIASFGAFLDTFGNFLIIAGDQPSSVTKTGNYLLVLECGGGSSCSSDVATMCLQKHRFRVQVAYHNQFDDTYGFGRAEPRSDAAGFYSFGDPSNIELLVKVLDFGGGRFKVFYGELTDLEFSLAITDMADPLAFTKTYTNSPGDCGGIDPDFLGGESRGTQPTPGLAGKGSCRRDSHTNCLLNGRFALTMAWHNQYNDTSGSGGAVALSDITGAFYFTDKSNLELVAKVIDFGNRIAVFYGALSDLEYDLTVTDTASGVAKVYHNAPGNYCGGLDNGAFP